MGIFDFFKKNKSKSIVKTDLTLEEIRKTNESNKKIWAKELHIVQPDSLSLKISGDLQEVDLWNYFLDGKPFNGIVYYLIDEDEIFSLPPENERLIDYEFEIKNGVKCGYQRIYYKNQNIQCVNWKENDVLNGIEKGWDENGNLEYETYFINGIRNGIEKGWHKNGNISYESNWLNGKRNGVYKEFDLNGKQTRELIYENDKIVVLDKKEDDRLNEILIKLAKEDPKEFEELKRKLSEED